MKFTRNILFQFFIDGKVISSGGDLTIVEVGTTATLKWNLTGVPDTVTTVYNIFYYDIKIFESTDSSNTVNKPLAYEPNNNLFEQNKINGILNLNNGNGTLIVTISNVQYKESGVFSFGFQSFVGIKEDVNITLDVQGCFLKCYYFVAPHFLLLNIMY